MISITKWDSNVSIRAAKVPGILGHQSSTREHIVIAVGRALGVEIGKAHTRN